MNTLAHLSATLVALLLVAAFFNPLPAGAGPRGGRGARGGGGGGGGGGGSFASRFQAIEKTTLTTDEIRELRYMREEEKLARDVYHTLGRIWKLRIFSNIESAEQQHMDHIKMVLDLYEVEDPIVDDRVGAFVNPQIASLYATLVAKGRTSLIDALQVGMTIEDVDIYDLQELLATATNDHVKITGHNLSKGSRNHMRSFWKVLVANGGTYAAQFLSQAEVDAIVSSDMERGVVYDENGDPLASRRRGRRHGRGHGACAGR